MTNEEMCKVVQLGLTVIGSALEEDLPCAYTYYGYLIGVSQAKIVAEEMECIEEMQAWLDEMVKMIGELFDNWNEMKEYMVELGFALLQNPSLLDDEEDEEESP